MSNATRSASVIIGGILFVVGAAVPTFAQTTPGNTTTLNDSPTVTGGGMNSSQTGLNDQRGSGSGGDPNCVGSSRIVGMPGQVGSNGSHLGPDGRVLTTEEAQQAGASNCVTVSPTTTSNSSAHGGDATSNSNSRSNAQGGSVEGSGNSANRNSNGAVSGANAENGGNTQSTTTGATTQTGSPINAGNDNSVTQIKYEAPKRNVYPATLIPGAVTPGTTGQHVQLGVTCANKGSVMFSNNVYAANKGRDIRGGIGLPFLSIQGGYSTTENGTLPAGTIPVGMSVMSMVGILNGTVLSQCDEPPTEQPPTTTTTITPPPVQRRLN